MKKGPRRVAALWLALAVFTSVIPVSAAHGQPAGDANPPSVQSSTPTQSHGRYSGEALVRAIVFGDLSGTPELRGQLQEFDQSPEAEELIESIIDQIHAEDPNFYGHFAAEVQSGEARRVQAALNAFGEAITPIIAEATPLAQPDEASPRCVYAAIYLVLFAVGAVVVGEAAVLINEAVATTQLYATTTVGSHAESTRSNLTQEKLVARLADLLS